MPKYKLSPKVISVHIAGKVYQHRDKMVFDTEGNNKFDAKQLESACKSGFLVEIEEKKAPASKAKKDDK